MPRIKASSPASWADPSRGIALAHVRWRTDWHSGGWNSFAVSAHPTPETRAAGRPSSDGLPVASNPIDDWNSLFDAVTMRLRTAAAQLVRGATPTDPTARREQMEATVLECVQELERLQRSVGAHHILAEALPGPVDACKQTSPWLDHTPPRGAAPGMGSPVAATLRNERLFCAQLEAALVDAKRHRQRLAVLQLQLGGCADIASRHGNDVANDVLAIVEERLAATIRLGDKVGRIGGDRFTCFLVDVPGREQLSHLACKLLDAIAEPLQVRTLALTVSPSIGIASWHDGEETAGTLLEAAHEAMRRATRDRSGYAFSDERAVVWAQWSESALGSHGT